MQLGQAVRRWNAWARAWSARLAYSWRAGAYRGGPGGASPPARPALPLSLRARRLGLLAAALLVLYYTLGAMIMGHIDDDPAFSAPTSERLPGESASVGNAVALLHRELDRYGWVANDPFFLPTSLLNNMAHYQMGLLDGVTRFTQGLSAALALEGAKDNDLVSAADHLLRPGTIWMWDLSQPLVFFGRSEGQYREGLVDLEGYNVGVAQGDSRFPKSEAALKTLIAGIAADLDESAYVLGSEAVRAPALFGRDTAERFYHARGRAYAELILMKGLGRDFAEILKTRVSGADWQAGLDALENAATFSPALLVNGAPDALLLPSHLVAESYNLLRARRALERIQARLS